MALIDRVREALAPTLEIQRELGSGGAGVVFLARDVALDRPVAVKVLRPEVATAVIVERFVREARVLARLRHPHVVPVHQAGSSGGILYFVMDLVRGESLAARLERGPLPPGEVRRLAVELLAVLAEAHELGIVHRDIKPANIFLEDGNALLADFGIARTASMSDKESALTVGGEFLGTPAYMAPEQLSREPASPATDLYAMGLVLFECLTGVRWPALLDPANAGWSGVPTPFVPVIRRALAVSPGERWTDAGSMAAALQGDGVRWKPLAAGAAVLAVLGAAAIAIGGGAGDPGEIPELQLGRFAATRPEEQAYADSVRLGVQASLAGLTDFRVRPVNGPGDARRSLLTADVALDGETLRVYAALRLGAEAPRRMQWSVPAAAWNQAVDSVATRVIDGVMGWESPWTPWQALPRLPAARDVLWRAERSYGEGAWEDARRGYAEAEALDSTCLLCAYRGADVSRWLEEPVDPGRRERVRAHADRFPRHYQLLIAADDLPLPARLDSLRAAALEYRDFSEAWYRYAEELFHRGPLYGHQRVEARDPFTRAIGIGVTPRSMLFDLSILLIAEREKDSAVAAVNRLSAAAVTPRFLGWALLSQTALGAAFTPGAPVPVAVTEALRAPEIAALPELPAGPRLLPLFGTPEGSLALGAAYAAIGSGTPMARSGMIAQVFGNAALGRADAMRRAGEALRAGFPGGEGDWLVTQMTTLLAALDPSPGAGDLVTARRDMGPTLRPDTRPATVRWSSAWLLAVMAVRAGDAGLADSLLLLLTDEPAPRHRAALVRAWEAAAAGQWARALALTEPIASDPVVIEGEAYDDLYLRAALKLSRAQWLAASGAPAAARRELRWHQHFHRHADPIAEPVGAEVDWAAGTLAEWWLASLGSTGDRETCRALSVVARNWAAGSARLVARADTARTRLRDLGCPDTP